MIKKNNSTTKPGLILIAQAIFISFLLASFNSPIYGSNLSASKKTKLTSNLDIQPDAIKNWFNSYDQIRRQAQLSPSERQKADEIMGKGLSIFMPGADKALAQNLLADLVKRYDTAVQEISKLQVIPATEQLHRAYCQYFVDARRLFSDYLKLQDDLLATDPNTGQPVASGLVERKENLASLDQNNKLLDERLRQQYGIPAYQYRPSHSSSSSPSSSSPPIMQYSTPKSPSVGDFPPRYQKAPYQNQLNY